MYPCSDSVRARVDWEHLTNRALRVHKDDRTATKLSLLGPPLSASKGAGEHSSDYLIDKPLGFPHPLQAGWPANETSVGSRRAPCAIAVQTTCIQRFSVRG